jgi:hypothetical protein
MSWVESGWVESGWVEGGVAPTGTVEVSNLKAEVLLRGATVDQLSLSLAGAEVVHKINEDNEQMLSLVGMYVVHGPVGVSKVILNVIED